MISAMKISPEDNVITAIEHIKKGENISYRDIDNSLKDIEVKDDIRIYHKIATRLISDGENIVKYGENIGLANGDIQVGQHVHDHNTSDHREDLKAKE